MKLKVSAETQAILDKDARFVDTQEERKLCACGKMFFPYRSFQRYCCDKHRIKYTSGRPSYYVKREKKTLICKECGKQFVSNDSKRHYCTPACYELFQSKRHVTPELRTCYVCGKQFQSAHWSKRYCSTECRVEARRQR
jgi:predicted transcriptional regulator